MQKLPDGETRSGRNSWARPASEADVAKQGLPGTYSCRLAAGTSTLRLDADGTYVLEVSPNDGARKTFGPSPWSPQAEAHGASAVRLEDWPTFQAVLADRADQLGDHRGVGLARVGVSDAGNLVLAIGVDPDNEYYFARQ